MPAMHITNTQTIHLFSLDWLALDAGTTATVAKYWYDAGNAHYQQPHA